MIKIIRNIFTGIKAYTGTIKLINTLGLWKYFLIPMGISFITALVIGLLAWSLSDNIANLLDKLWIWEWGSQTFHSIGEVIGALVVIAIGLILYKHIILALSAPFMSPVSEKIEAYLTHNNHTHRETTNAAQLWRGIKINTRNLLMELLLTIPILLLSFIPILNFFTSILLFLVQSYYAGFGNMDYTLERHYEVAQSVQFVKKHRGIAIGNGIVFIGMLLLPVIGIILVLPLSVTASTTQTVKLIRLEKEKLNAQKKV